MIQQEDDWYIAKCVENDVASQGKTIDEAIGNLKEAIALYYEDEKEEIILPKNDQIFVTTLEIAI